MFVLAQTDRVADDALVFWLIVDVSIIILPVEAAMQSGLPEALRTFDTPPKSQIMLDWPSFLVPSLVAAIFLLFKFLGAVAAHRSHRASVAAKETRP